MILWTLLVILPVCASSALSAGECFWHFYARSRWACEWVEQLLRVLFWFATSVTAWHARVNCTKMSLSYQKRRNPKLQLPAAPAEPATPEWATWPWAECWAPARSAAPTPRSSSASTDRLPPPASGRPARLQSAASATQPSPARRTLPLPWATPLSATLTPGGSPRRGWRRRRRSSSTWRRSSSSHTSSWCSAPPAPPQWCWSAPRTTGTPGRPSGISPGTVRRCLAWLRDGRWGRAERHAPPSTLELFLVPEERWVQWLVRRMLLLLVIWWYLLLWNIRSTWAWAGVTKHQKVDKHGLHVSES